MGLAMIPLSSFATDDEATAFAELLCLTFNTEYDRLLAASNRGDRTDVALQEA